MRRSLAFLLSLGLTASLLGAAPVAAEPSGVVTIIRDEFGVPHVRADSVDDLLFGVGYAQGQDRLWQAEFFRRLATGTLAELLGPDFLESDILARTVFGSPERRAEQFAAADPEMQVIIESFVAGLNEAIDDAEAGGTLPVEFAAFGFIPRPWTVDDSLAISFLLTDNFGINGADELGNALDFAELVALHGPDTAAAIFADTHWLDDPSAPTTVPGGAGAGSSAAGLSAPRLPAGVGEAAARFTGLVADRDAALERFGLRKAPSSNAIVIGPTMSADGRPLLLGGPQMGYSTPQINMEIGIHGAGFDVVGIIIPGIPLVPLGVGKGYAWTLTTGGTDNADIFAEVLDPSDPSRYWHDGTWKSLDCRIEEIGVAGGDPVAHTICESVHGPVVAVADTTAYTLSSVARNRELDSYLAWANLSRTRSIDEFFGAASGIAYNFNLFYVDVAGNFAYWHMGNIPIRAPGVNPFFPTPGTGEFDWQGIIPFDAMPHAINPAQGWMTSWNNKPAPGWPNSSTGFWSFGPVHRVNTLNNLMAEQAPGTVTVDTLADINRLAGFTTDTPSGNAGAVFTSTLLPGLMDAVAPGADPRLPDVLAMLADWDLLQTDDDGNGHYDQPQVAVFNTWWDHLIGSVFADDLGGTLNAVVAGNLVSRLLDGPAAALPLAHDYLDGATSAEAVTGALVAALDDLTAAYGSPDPATWLQPIAVINWGALGAAAVPDTIWMNRGTYNQIVHAGPRDGFFAMNVVAPGQSGDPFSPHFADQLPLYLTWTYKPVRRTIADLRGNTESILRLPAP